jgi:glyoxylase-like metal-dependent hydrolase (beta-lactamase superfamily II)
MGLPASDEMIMLLNRRRFLAGASALAVAPLWPRHALAADSYSFKQGNFEITVVSDGFITLPGNIIAPDASPEELAEILRRLGGSSGNAEAKANVPLIRSGSDLILVDIGSGDKYQPTDGRLAQNLKAAGIDPASITKVVFTHGHPDHIWATLGGDGRLTYPNAAYFVGATEWDFWMAPDFVTKMPAGTHDFFRGAQRDLSAIKDRVTMLKPGDDIVTGLRVLDTAGHTPGHISLEVAGGEGLIITADAMTNHIVSFEHPGWKFGFDAIHDLAIANRKALVDRAATDKTKLLGYHWTYPGVGFAERKGNAYQFVAAT